MERFMSRRQTEGAETWRRLLNWDRGHSASERLSAHILRFAGYSSVDPSHPLGGPDGLKDILCEKDDKRWVAAVYFPRGSKNFSDVKYKFIDDLEGVQDNNADGLIFLSNQELTLGQRDQLIEEANNVDVDLFHLERIASILDSPPNYGIRLEFLDIEMTKEEQLAFMAASHRTIIELRQELMKIASYIEQSESLREEFEKVRESDMPKDPYYVSPVPIANPHSISSIVTSDKKLHNCSNCGFGFFVRNLNMYKGLPGIDPMAVTCPNCGNADKL